MKKTLFITGGSRGIGRGIALVFAQNGYDVAFTYHTAEDAEHCKCSFVVRFLRRKKENE